MWELIYSGIVLVLVYKVLIAPFFGKDRLTKLETRLLATEDRLEKLVANLHRQNLDVPLDTTQGEAHPAAPEPTSALASSTLQPSFAPPTKSEIRTAQARDKELRDKQIKPSQSPSVHDNAEEKSAVVAQQAAYVPKQQGDFPQTKPSMSFEERFGARLPVWIGGIALALAGFYLVKLSIQAGLLNPAVRLVLATLFGGALLTLADKIRMRPNFKYKPDFANARQIAQSLTGAGIAVLYGVTFAATNIYNYLPELVGYMAMAGVTAAAVVLSLRHGAPIALLGLVGGFLTPMIKGNGQLGAPLLFIYLGLTFLGLMLVFRAQKWWELSVLAVVACWSWAVFWLFNIRSPMDTSIITLFLMFVAGVTLFATRNDPKSAHRDDPQIAVHSSKQFLNRVAVLGAAVLSALAVKLGGYVAVDWGLFALISAATMALAYFKDEDYGFVPWISMGAVGLLLLSSQVDRSFSFLALVAGFAALYTIPSYKIMWRSKAPLMWAGLFSAATIGAYLIGFFKTRFVFILTQQVDVGGLSTAQWAMVALALAALHCLMAKRVLSFYKGHKNRDHLLALFSLGTTGFLSFGVCALANTFYWPLIIAAQCLATAWIASQLRLPILRKVCIMLVGVFGFAHSGQVAEMVIFGQASWFGAITKFVQTILDNPIISFGLPSAFFAGTSLLLRKDRDGADVRMIEVVSIVLLTALVYFGLLKLLVLPNAAFSELPSLIERNIITSGFFFVALLCLFLGKIGQRRAVLQSGIVLFSAGFLRILLLEYGLHNPLVSREVISGVVGLNSLLLPFGLPLLWLYLAGKCLDLKETGGWGRFYYAMGFVSLFTLVTLNVRYMFHGAQLSVGLTGDGELYAYSAAWLLLGLLVLVFGTLKKEKFIRLAGLGLVGLTIFKVFLYDASALEGLWRVASFLGLGISLIGLSSFYTRFVLEQEDDT